MQVRSHKIDFATDFRRFPQNLPEPLQVQTGYFKAGRISGRFAQTFASVQCTLQLAYCTVASTNQRVRSGVPSEAEQGFEQFSQSYALQALSLSFVNQSKTMQELH